MDRSQLTFPLSGPPGSNGSGSAAVRPQLVDNRPAVVDPEAPNTAPPATPRSQPAKATKARKASAATKSPARRKPATKRRTPAKVPERAPAWERFVVSVGAAAVRLVAAAVSYEHMRALAVEAGEGWRSWLLPISVDGLAVVALVTIGRARRSGQPVGLAWLALSLALAASLAANVAAAEPTAAGRVMAAWPPVALLMAEVINKHRGGAGANQVTASVPSDRAKGGGA
jgi:hypothetical protein